MRALDTPPGRRLPARDVHVVKPTLGVQLLNTATFEPPDVHTSDCNTDVKIGVTSIAVTEEGQTDRGDPTTRDVWLPFTECQFVR